MLQQTSHAAVMPSHVSPRVGIKASLPVASPSRVLVPPYNTSTGPRMQVMATGPHLPADTARPHVPVHSGQTSGLAERVCDKLHDANITCDLQASKMTSMHAHMWQQQQNRQFCAQPQNCRLQPQPMSAYMTQQHRAQAPVAGCGTVPDWSSRFNGQSPYQQSEKLAHHHHQQQQRLMMPGGTMIRQQLPTYQNVIEHRHQDMLLKQAWQQRQLIHLPSSSQRHRYVVANVASESCDVGGFASSECVMAPSSSSAVSTV